MVCFNKLLVYWVGGGGEMLSDDVTQPHYPHTKRTQSTAKWKSTLYIKAEAYTHS